MLADSLLVAALMGIILFPVIYAFYFKLQRKVLFLAACYGLEQIITLLLIGLVSPLILLRVFTFPQLEANGSLEDIGWLVETMGFFQDYWYWITPVILLLVPLSVHRKFQDVFVRQQNR
jgi:hypothetical protein